ncbi:MAG: hypothetical protein N2C12_04550 [Planctomycetales bacterium]
MSPDSESSSSWLHYLLAFTSFAMIALALMTDKIERRQTQIEQQYHGIQEMQRRDSGQTGSDEPTEPEQQPLLLTMRPLMLLLGGVLLVAWVVQMVRLRRRASQGHPANAKV